MLRRGLHVIATTTGTVFLLFVVVNVLAWAALREDRGPPSYFRSVEEALAAEPAAVRAAYPGRSDEEIRALSARWSVAAHPVLELMQMPAAGPYYNVGREGARSNGGAPAELDGAIWMFGGSTVFGDGVADADTIAAHMERAATSTGTRVLNFGTQGAHQNLEIAKLVLLLQKGHRPSAVVFLDGLNDVIAVLASPFEPAETPMRPHNAYGERVNVETARVQPFALALTELPIVRWWRGPAAPFAETEVTDVYVRSLYHEDPAAHFARVAARPGFARSAAARPHYAAKLVSYYRGNLELLEGLARGFGFRLLVAYQPNGLLYAENPFVRDRTVYAASELRATVLHLHDAVRAELAAGRLRMVDLSQLHDRCAAPYADAVHYSPELSRLLGEALADRLRR